MKIIKYIIFVGTSINCLYYKIIINIQTKLRIYLFRIFCTLNNYFKLTTLLLNFKTLKKHILNIFKLIITLITWYHIYASFFIICYKKYRWVLAIYFLICCYFTTKIYQKLSILCYFVAFYLVIHLVLLFFFYNVFEIIKRVCQWYVK